MSELDDILTQDGKYIKPGVYRISGETSIRPWVKVHIGLCFITENTALAPGQYDLSGIVSYDTGEIVMKEHRKQALKKWKNFEEKKNQYSGKVTCVPTNLTAEPVNMIHGVDDPEGEDPNATHKYTLSGSITCKMKYSDIPGLTLIVENELPSKKTYAVSGKVDLVGIEHGTTKIRGVSVFSLCPANLGRFTVSGELRVKLSDIENPEGRLKDDEGPKGEPKSTTDPKQQEEKVISQSRACKCHVPKTR